MDSIPYAQLASAVMLLHLGVVLFVVGGLLLIVAGNLRHWPWVNAPWFRLAHLAAIAVVIAEAWFGVMCPLTTLELWLRARAGMGSYEGGFIDNWIGRLLYYDAPEWVFTAAYSLFGLAVVAAWWFFPPRLGRARPLQHPDPAVNQRIRG